MFAIAIPSINRADLLCEALRVYRDTFRETEILICDNGRQNLLQSSDNVKVFKQKRNLGVSGSWNFLAKKVFEKYAHVLILNDDVIIQKKYAELTPFAEPNLSSDFIYAEVGFAAFFLSLKTYRIVGEFDEGFYPAYFEDNDYLYRMKLKNLNIQQTEALNPEVFRVSQSIALNPGLNLRFEINKQRYIKKWGGMPLHEVFKTAYNR